MLKPLIHASIVLNRTPFLTRTSTVFESAYHEYQSRIRRALHNPFPYEFYFKHGSPMEARFMHEERARERNAFGQGFSEGDGGTNEGYESEGEVLMPREHAADRKGDMKSLDRKGGRNLYLLLQERGGGEPWRFPRGKVEKGELLHQAAQRDLYAECGERMDIWVVSQTPIGFYEAPSQTKRRDLAFFIKAHILAGQAHPNENLIKEFAWLTKEEIQRRVDERYWHEIKDMLSDC